MTFNNKNIDFQLLVITPSGVKHLVKWEGTTLNLRNNFIYSEGIKALAKWRGTSLVLDVKCIDDVKALVRWKGTSFDIKFIYGIENVKLLAEWKGTTFNILGYTGETWQTLASQWQGINFNNNRQYCHFDKNDWVGIKRLCIIPCCSSSPGCKRTTSLTKKFKKRYDKIVIRKLGNYFYRDIQLYVIGKFLT